MKATSKGYFADAASQSTKNITETTVLVQDFFLRKIPGDEITFVNGGEPDYYMRDGERVFLFEYKNIVLGAETKLSGDPEVIWNEVQRKLVKDDSGKDEGVSQLANVIE